MQKISQGIFVIIFTIFRLSFLGCDSDISVDPVVEPPIPDPEPIPEFYRGDLVVDLPNGVRMPFMWVEPGTFMMGTPQSEFENLSEPFEGPSSNLDPTVVRMMPEIPQHQVTITKGFYLGKYEVTVEQWASFMSSEGDFSIDQVRYPIYKIMLHSALAFIDSLNQMGDGAVYRLPTEAEWEFAARAGTTTTWWFGSWNDARSGKISREELREFTGMDFYRPGMSYSPQEVGLTIPNPWGLYDMYGNVAEWVWEGALRTYSNESQVDPLGPKQGYIEYPSVLTANGKERHDHIHLYRGAVNADLPWWWMRPAFRGVYLYLDVPASPGIGFRIVREKK